MCIALKCNKFKTIQINSTFFRKPKFNNRDNNPIKDNYIKVENFNIEGSKKATNVYIPSNKVNTSSLSTLILNLISIVKNNILVSFLVVLLFSGIITGTVFTKNAGESLIDNLRIVFLSNLSLRASQPLLDTFSTSIAASFIFVFLSVLMGMSMWGNITVPFLSFFKGFGLGLSSGYLYITYGFKGILFNLIVIFPGAFLSSIALIISSKEAMRFSYMLFMSGARIRRKVRSAPNLKVFLMYNCRSFIIVAISAVIDMLFNWWFSGLFKF